MWCRVIGWFVILVLKNCLLDVERVVRCLFGGLELFFGFLGFEGCGWWRFWGWVF